MRPPSPISSSSLERESLTTCPRSGSGLAFAVIISPILLQELPHPSQRQTAASLFNTCYILGSIVAAWTIFGTGNLSTSWSWRIPYSASRCLSPARAPTDTLSRAVIQIGPALFALVAVFFVPESPRFHLGRGDEQACLDFLVRYHGNGEETELVRFEYEEMKDTLRKEREATQFGWSILWATSANRRRTALVLWIGFCQCMSGQAIITLCVLASRTLPPSASLFLARALEPVLTTRRRRSYYTSILSLVGLTDTQRVTGINGGLQIFNWMAALLVRPSSSRGLLLVAQD